MATKISAVLQSSNLRLFGSQNLQYNLKTWQSALSQAQKKTAQIATIEICTVFGLLWLMVVDKSRLENTLWLIGIDFFFIMLILRKLNIFYCD